MLREGKFGTQEAVSIVTIAICNKTLLTSPSYILKELGTSGWYMTFISGIMAGIAFFLIWLMLKRFPGKNIVEIYDVTLGRGFGLIFSFLLMVSFLVSSGLYTREFIDVMKVYIFPVTHSGILIGAEVVLAASLSFIGLEAIARVAKLAAYFALFSILLLVVLSSNYFNLSYIFPVLSFGFVKTLTTGITRSTAYAEVVILAVLAGSIQGTGNIKKAGVASLIISGAILSLVQLVAILVFSYTGAGEVVSLMYVLSRIIKLGGFFQRLDPLFLLLFITVSTIAVSVLLYTAVSITCKMLRLQDARPVILPVGLLIFTLAMMPKDLSTLVDVYVPLLRLYGSITFYILPILVLIIAILRNKKGEDRHA